MSFESEMPETVRTLDFKMKDESTQILAVGGGMGSVVIFKVQYVEVEESASRKEKTKKQLPVSVEKCFQVWEQDMLGIELLAFSTAANKIFLATSKGRYMLNLLFTKSMWYTLLRDFRGPILI
jgi:hypothetical protein